MKRIKNKSIFWKTIAIVMPIVTIMNVIVLAASYKITYDFSYEKCEKDVTTAAKVIEDFAALYDMNDKAEVKELGESMSALCREFGISYAYVIEVDTEAETEKYISIGYGENASEAFKLERHTGDVVKGMLSKEQIQVANGEVESGCNHLKNRFDDTIVCYVPLKHQYNEAKKTFEEREEFDKLIAAEISFTQVLQRFRSNFAYIILFTLAMSVVMVVAFALILNHRIAKPVRKITQSIDAFARDHKKGFQKIEIQDSTELGYMADAFNSMTEEIGAYIEDIEHLHKEKHTQEAEMNIAQKIQLGLLPPTAFYTQKANVDAYILPARDVGGDFYHYHVTESGKLNIAIADVSGKGVAAALFVSRAITLLQMLGSLGLSPAQAMQSYNDKLAAQNPNNLFITTFIATYDPVSRELTYTNAGHNVPYILSDTLIALDGAVGMAAGVFAGESYEQKTVTLQPGDELFLYTDGVNEAQNRAGELFSTERLEQILGAHTGEYRQQVIEDVLREIEAFSDGAEQSDDITMLCLKTEGAFYHREMTVQSDVQNLTLINREIAQIPDIDEMLKLNLNLMAEEIFVNLCSYAYSDKQGEVFFSINVGDRVELVFKDRGTRYNPTRNLLQIEQYDHEHTVGGLGKFITFEIADAYEYRYENGENVLRLEKNIERNTNEA